jgi:hypothetical protein
MCVVSAVHQGYDQVIPQRHHWPLNPVAPKTISEEDIRRILDAYRESLDLARQVDEIAERPDCEDPVKAELLDRVAEIEARLDEIEARFRPLD